MTARPTQAPLSVSDETRIAMALALCRRWQQSEFHQQFYELRSDEPKLPYWLDLVDAVLDLLLGAWIRQAQGAAQ
ncbi:MAG: hypothetical protein EPN74_02020 [Rhodanobacter sp.]|nr:MAG: hypothetical protein EPN74_02020 [Rhodanobacter sp.]